MRLDGRWDEPYDGPEPPKADRALAVVVCGLALLAIVTCVVLAVVNHG